MLLVTFNINDKYSQRYFEALGGQGSWRAFNITNGNSVSYSNLAKKPLSQWLASQDYGEWKGPLVLAGWSAGCFAIREWMRDPAAREMTDAIILLDGLHSPGAQCDPAAIDGVLKYAAAGKPLLLTHTAAAPTGYASTTSCANLVKQSAGAKTTVVGSSGSDAAAHAAQLEQATPLIKQDITPFLKGGISFDWRWALVLGGVTALIAVGVAQGSRRKRERRALAAAR